MSEEYQSHYDSDTVRLVMDAIYRSEARRALVKIVGYDYWEPGAKPPACTPEVRTMGRSTPPH
jgi:hypothetical protein